MKNKYGYNILGILTLILPMMSFILISTIVNKPFDAELFKDTETSTIVFEPYEDDYVVYSEKASYNGFTVPYNEEYALLIEENEIVKIEKDYYTPYFMEETQRYVLINLEEIPPTVEKTNTWTISIATMIAIGIVALVIGGKMDLLKKRPRASALISLFVLTLIFGGLSAIITDMYNVFLVATASWGAYCIEYLIKQGKISKQDGEKKESKLLDALKEAFNE